MDSYRRSIRENIAGGMLRRQKPAACIVRTPNVEALRCARGRCAGLSAACVRRPRGMVRSLGTWMVRSMGRKCWRWRGRAVPQRFQSLSTLRIIFHIRLHDNPVDLAAGPLTSQSSYAPRANAHRPAR